MKRDFLRLLDLKAGEIEAIWDRARAYKLGRVKEEPLKGKTVGLLFEKPSTRTRVSFEVAVLRTGGQASVYQLPGHPVGPQRTDQGYGPGSFPLFGLPGGADLFPADVWKNWPATPISRWSTP